MKIVDSYDEGEEKMSEFFSILTAFIDERRGGNDISQIEMGYVWKDDKENGRYFCTLATLFIFGERPSLFLIGKWGVFYCKKRER